MLQTYDHIISLGENCQTAMTLRDLGLRKEAFPFDWHGIQDFSIGGNGGLQKKIDIICSDFEKFFNQEDFEEFFADWTTGHRLIWNKRTGLKFLHEFPKDISITDYFPMFIKKYQKRIDRLYSILNSGESILFVFIEFYAKLSDDELQCIYDKLKRSFPKSNVSFLIIKNNPGLSKYELVQRNVLPTVCVCEINNDFSKDTGKGSGNVGNKDLYKQIISKYCETGGDNIESYFCTTQFQKDVYKKFDYLGWKVNDVIPNKLNDISGKLNTIMGQMPERITYGNLFEIEFIKKHFADFDISTYKADVMKLLDGLDDVSAYNVQQVLYRMKRLVENDYNTGINLFTLLEQQEIRHQIQEQDKVISLDKDLYYHCGCYLPQKHFEGIVFDQNMNLSLFPANVLSKIHNKDIIDAGAYIGDSAFVLNKLHPRKIYAFEANKKNYDLLQKTLTLNSLSNVVSENIVLADQTNVTAYVVDNDACSAVTKIQEDSDMCCQMTTLDDYISKHPEIKVGLIKVDIEGAEQRFLAGAIETIKKHKPALIISIYHNWSDFLHIKKFLSDLDIGYKFIVSKPMPGAIILETQLFAYVAPKKFWF